MLIAESDLNTKTQLPKEFFFFFKEALSRSFSFDSETTHCIKGKLGSFVHLNIFSLLRNTITSLSGQTSKYSEIPWARVIFFHSSDSTICDVSFHTLPKQFNIFRFVLNNYSNEENHPIDKKRTGIRKRFDPLKMMNNASLPPLNV